MKEFMIIRFILATTLALASGTSAFAEIVILGDGGLTNLVVNVPTGKVMIVRASSLRDAENKVSVSRGGVTFQPGIDAGFDTRFQPRYLAGPCTFTYSPLYGDMDTSVFDYEVVPANDIQTLVATNASVIQVPTGKRLRLLDGSYPLTLAVELTNGASATFSVSPRPDPGFGIVCNTEGFELSGPIAVTVSGDQFGQKPFFLTCFFASDVTQALGQSIQSPVGSIVTVEKSTDLQTWYPAFTTTEKSAPKAFYRLRVTR
jgi:hypothetical protein